MMTMKGKIDPSDIQEDLLRHFILNSIRRYNVKFRKTYGEMVIACDDSWSWRKNVFPYYKANRKKNREESGLDWNSIFASLHKIRSELKEFFPYRVIHIATAEADDIIGTMCHKFANTNEKIMILSGDKDFRQLQVYFNVEQYDPVRDKKVKENNPEQYLKEHIIRGDTGDGVPNALSSDDSLVLGTRQKPVSQKKLDVWLTQDPLDYDSTLLRGFKRNEQLIDLTFTPSELQESILSEYESQEGKGRQHLMNYFIQHRLKNLMESITEF